MNQKRKLQLFQIHQQHDQSGNISKHLLQGALLCFLRFNCTVIQVSVHVNGLQRLKSQRLSQREFLSTDCSYLTSLGHSLNIVLGNQLLGFKLNKRQVKLKCQDVTPTLKLCWVHFLSRTIYTVLFAVFQKVKSNSFVDIATLTLSLQSPFVLCTAWS